jgi:hypothetical protein
MPLPVTNSDGDLPQWAINALIWFAVLVTGLFTGIFGWMQRKYILKVDSHEDQIGKLSSIFATLEVVNEMEDKISALVSRSELLAYMKDLRAEQLRMHGENLNNGNQTRADIGKIHERIDSVLRNGNGR